MEPILRFDNVSKHYPNGVHALKGVSFEVAEGEFISVIGPSGSGKSTLLRVINRLISISGGTVWLDGQAVSAQRGTALRQLRRKVGMISIAVLSLLYSLVLGILFGMLAARNIFRLPWLSVLTQSFFTFLRAVPTPVWVLLMLVCLGMGPEAGVAGLCVHTTAFFTKSFAQSFESIPDETIEALEVTGAGRLSIFVNAVLPAALSQIVAWAGMRLETNFSECAILGMVGAGGVGYVISNSLQGYDYGTAGVAILLVFLVAYSIERIFVRVKKKFY